MPASQRSLDITDKYRAGMVTLRDRAKREAVRTWNAIDPDDLSGSYKVGMLALSVEILQRESARLSSGYLSAFIESELGRPVRPQIVDARQVGSGRSGDDLNKTLRAPLIDVKVAIRDGKTPQEGLALGRSRLVRMVGLATDTAAREALRTGMEISPFVAGWRRAVKGTCGACMGLAEDALAPAGTALEIHPDCECVSEAVARNDFDPKVGERAELREAKELINNAWQDVTGTVRGAVVKKDAETVMLNAGTATKPRWVAGKRLHLYKPERQVRRAVDNLGHSEQAFMQKLTKAEFKAVDSYKGYGYKNINGQLRAGKPGGKTVEALDRAVQKGSLGTDTTLFRSLHLPDGKGVGDTFQDLAFASTSKQRNVASRFFKKGSAGKRVLLRINGKAGQRGAHLPGQDELEFVLPRGTRFRLLKEKVESGIRVFDVELV